jgi:hypothetical protein
MIAIILYFFKKSNTDIPNSFHSTISNLDTKILETPWGAIDIIGKETSFKQT